MIYSLFSRQDSYSNKLCQEIFEFLNDIKGWEYNDLDPELVICVGGDGTLLRAIHEHLDQLDKILFVGLHTGTLGFFTDYTKEEFGDFLYDITHKTAKIETSSLLEMHAQDEIYYALNEFRIGSFLNTVNYTIYIDGEFFERTSGSGICVCTQAGSTGANRGLEGAVVDNGLDVLELTEIMPVFHKNHHSLKNPYIMRSDRELTVKGESLKISEICGDYLNLDIKNASTLTIRSSDKKVRFARFKPYSYLKRLRNLF